MQISPLYTAPGCSTLLCTPGFFRAVFNLFTFTFSFSTSHNSSTLALQLLLPKLLDMDGPAPGLPQKLDEGDVNVPSLLPRDAASGMRMAPFSNLSAWASSQLVSTEGRSCGEVE
jgi:hypothetical protein